ncbi:MAG: CHRD domain-containing protein, partial [Acidobacteria bacterium]|nr:CHRD domain-containing protein [Acidobacteriota bacterium]
MKRFAGLAFAFLLLLLPNAIRAEEMSFVATLSGDNEVPPSATGATGVAHVVVDTDSNRLRFEVHVFDFTNTLVASHIHRAPAGVNGPV